MSEEITTGYLFAEIYSSSIIIDSIRLFDTVQDAENYVRDDYRKCRDRGSMHGRAYWRRHRVYKIWNDKAPNLLPLKERIAMLEGIE